MPRIRTIKPDAFLSESLSEVPRGTRWTFAGLWTYADDKGRGRDDIRLIKAALYPLDDSVSLEDVTTDLWLLAGIGAVCRYVVDGRNYLHMPNWHHQKINRPTPAKSPPCPVHEDGVRGHVLDADASVSPHGAVTEPSRGEGKGREREVDREGKGKPGSPTPHGAFTESDADAPTTPKGLALVADRDDVDRICTHLADRIENNGAKRPAIGKGWRDAARLMLDADNRSEDDVHAAIEWCQSDEFWRSNILSLPKLREKYDTLRLQAQRRPGGGRAAEQSALLERAMARAEARERSGA